MACWVAGWQAQRQQEGTAQPAGGGPSPARQHEPAQLPFLGEQAHHGGDLAPLVQVAAHADAAAVLGGELRWGGRHAGEGSITHCSRCGRPHQRTLQHALQHAGILVPACCEQASGGPLTSSCSCRHCACRRSLSASNWSITRCAVASSALSSALASVFFMASRCSDWPAARGRGRAGQALSVPRPPRRQDRRDRAHARTESRIDPRGARAGQGRAGNASCSARSVRCARAAVAARPGCADLAQQGRTVPPGPCAPAQLGCPSTDATGGGWGRARQPVRVALPVLGRCGTARYRSKRTRLAAALRVPAPVHGWVSRTGSRTREAGGATPLNPCTGRGPCIYLGIHHRIGVRDGCGRGTIAQQTASWTTVAARPPAH